MSKPSARYTPTTNDKIDDAADKLGKVYQQLYDTPPSVLDRQQIMAKVLEVINDLEAISERPVKSTPENLQAYS
jgi:hypothetical protein